MKNISRHLLGLFQGLPGAKRWRRYISEHAHLDAANEQLLLQALEHMRGRAAGSAAVQAMHRMNRTIRMTLMKKWLMHIASGIHPRPGGGRGCWAQSLDEAASQAARQYNAKVLSARTVQEGDKRVHVIKLLTKDGVVKTVRVTVREQLSALEVATCEFC